MVATSSTETIKQQRDVVRELYGYPEGLLELPRKLASLPHKGFFRVGSSAICYGSTQHPCPSTAHEPLPNLLRAMSRRDGGALPFDPAEVLDNLRLEQYPSGDHSVLSTALLRKLYYGVRPLLSDRIRNTLQRRYFKGWEAIPFPVWPVDTSVEGLSRELLREAMVVNGLDRIPFIWFWPHKATSTALVTHDVETDMGRDFIPRLLQVDNEFGVKASYQLVPTVRYEVTSALLDHIRRNGCEVNVHDLTHEGNLFADRESFRKHAVEINRHARDYGSKGFRAACMYRNQAWFGDLEVDYDMSVPNVAHLEPQRGGCCTVFPYFVGDMVELPLTMTQDFTLFRMLGSYSMDLWERQIGMVMEQHGLMSFIVHPDYIVEDRPLAAYRTLLQRIAELRDQDGVWVPTPGEAAVWWRQRRDMRLVASSTGYRIEGRGQERASLAYACLDGDSVRYEIV